jgi:hypothetical protein
MILLSWCRECLLFQLSTERYYSGDSYFREQSFYSNKFTWHFPMDPSACLCYPSQPGVTQTFPQVLLTMWGLLSQWRRHICAPGDPHNRLQCRSSFTVHQRHPVVVRRRGTLPSGSCLHVRVSGGLWQHGLWWARRWARLWVLAWVYTPCGDLTTSVIRTVTLGLAY